MHNKPQILNETQLRQMRKLDLNLLIILYDLVQTCSTTETASRLARTQPVVSQSLNRLREFFDDPLLIRKGPTLTPSPLALQLVKPLELHLRGISNLISGGDIFDPATSNRDVVLAGVDITLGPQMAIMRRLRQDAPNLNIKLDVHAKSISSLIATETDVLFALYPETYPSSITQYNLGSMHWGVLVNNDHPISNTPTLDEWLNYSHVQVTTGTHTRSPINDALYQLNVKRKIGLQVDLFLQALHAVAASDMLFTTLTTLTEDFSATLGLRRVELPFDVAPVPAAILVRNTHYDSFSTWLGNSIKDCLNSSA